MGGGDSSGWAWCGAPLHRSQTWNVELSYEVGEAIGNETMLLGGVGWYGPGMNLHRNPLAGRKPSTTARMLFRAVSLAPQL